MINNRHIWEGWTVQDFIDELEPIFNQILDNSKRFRTKSFETNEELKRWCMDNQKKKKKYIPEVVTYFKNKL